MCLRRNKIYPQPKQKSSVWYRSGLHRPKSAHVPALLYLIIPVLVAANKPLVKTSESAYTEGMQISLLTIGRCRTPYLQEGGMDYARRIGRYATLNHIEAKEERAAGGMPAAEIVRREGERLLQAIPQNAFVVALDPAGPTCCSEDLAERISQLGLQGKSRIAFVIGGAFGLASEVIQRADWRLSLSPMTFPHELARLILLEQIYRAFTILRGERYHK